MPIGFRRVERGGRHETAARPTSEWKAATSCGIAVIGDAPGDHRADRAADGDADDDQRRSPPKDGLGEEQRRQDGEPHADHAEDVALARASSDGTGRAAPG